MRIPVTDITTGMTILRDSQEWLVQSVNDELEHEVIVGVECVYGNVGQHNDWHFNRDETVLARP